MTIRSGAVRALTGTSLEELVAMTIRSGMPDYPPGGRGILFSFLMKAFAFAPLPLGKPGSGHIDIATKLPRRSFDICGAPVGLKLSGSFMRLRSAGLLARGFRLHLFFLFLLEQ